jgi:ankyrin repeat protein
MMVSDREVNPIFAACKTYGSTEVDELIEAKADVNVTDVNGDSPLIIAARACNCLKSLIAAGADLNHRNNAGESALDVAMSYGPGDHEAGVLLIEAGAAVGEDQEVFDSVRQCECTSNHPIVKHWCDKNGLKHSWAASCCVTERADDNRCMFYACEEGDFNKHAMGPGCPWARNGYGQTVAMCNVTNWRSFCNVVAFKDIDVRAYPDFKGLTLLHHAVKGASRKVLREVLKQGPDATAKDCKGRTPMMLLQIRLKRAGVVEDVDEDIEDDSDDYFYEDEDADDSDYEYYRYTSWEDDPLKVDYRDDDSPIDMLKKYIRASSQSEKKAGTPKRV